MPNLRTYNRPPYHIVLLHGGPGAPGYMAPVARELAGAGTVGVLEPLQTADTLDGQVEEVRELLAARAEAPVTVIGSSWGAMLGYVVAARHPALVAKLVMIGSAVFTEESSAAVKRTRRERLSADEREELDALSTRLADPALIDKRATFGRMAEIIGRADMYDPLTRDTETIEYQHEINVGVWAGARELRETGAMVDLGRRIMCPVVIIHGDYDPHPIEGIREPLAPVVAHLRVILLERCGHYPWLERQARDEFYRVLRSEIAATGVA